MLWKPICSSGTLTHNNDDDDNDVICHINAFTLELGKILCSYFKGF